MKNLLRNVTEIGLICLWLGVIASQALALDISGTVWHEDGVTPFEGAWVYAISHNAPHHDNLLHTDYYGPVQTNRSGQYVLTHLPEAYLNVRAFAPKMYPQQWDVDASKSNEKTQHDFVLVSAPVLTGRVLSLSVDKIWFNFDREGQGSIGGHTSVQPDGTFTIVLAGSGEYEQDEPKVTEQANQYSSHSLYTIEEIRQLPERLAYSLQIRPAGYEPIFYPRLTFKRGEVTSLEISPRQTTGSISGRVVDAAGMPLKGVGLQVWPPLEAQKPNRNLMENLTAMSDEQGQFVLLDVPSGAYLIDSWVPPETMDSGQPRYTFNQRQISVVEGMPVRQLEIIAKPNPNRMPVIWVSGRVLAADGETPLADRIVSYRVWGHQGVSIEDFGGHLKTDHEGGYRLRLSGGGTYWLTFFLNGSPITQHFEVVAGQDIRDFNYIMKSLPDEEMPVTGQAIEQATGEPIPNLPLLVQTLPPGFLIRLTTDAQGRFRLDQFPPQDGRLKLQFGDYQAYPYSPHWEEVELIDGKARDIVVPLQRTAKLTVKVTSKQYNVQHSRVWLDGPQDGSRNGIGGERGGPEHDYVFDNCPPGIYRISAHADGFEPQRRTLEVKPGVYDMELTFELEAHPRPSIFGRVEWPDGKPAENVTVWLLQQQRRGYLKKEFLTQADGAFTFQELISWAYQIVLNVPGFPIQEQQITLYENDLQNFVFRLKRGTSVRGKLAFEEGVPYPERPLLVLGRDQLAQGYVMTSRIQGAWQPHRMLWSLPSHFSFQHHFAHFSEEDAFTFVFDRVLPGEYWISFWDDGPPDGTGQAIPLIVPMKIVVEDVEEQFIEIPIEKMGVLTGQVFDGQSKKPIPDARISIELSIEGKTFQKTVHTDKDGRYRCELPAGKYRLMVYAPDSHLKVTLETIEVLKNQVKTVDVPLIDVN